MNSDVEDQIKRKTLYVDLANDIKQRLDNNQSKYEKLVLEYSIRNQLRCKGNLVWHYYKDERKYYDSLLQYSREHLMLYPYHLSDKVVRGLRLTPFGYYCQMMQDIMAAERSYDSLPNFTAADCLRLLGIGRNQYIDLMNQTRATGRMGKLFRRKPNRDLLPAKPIDDIPIEPWWQISHGFVTEEDIKMCSADEKVVIDQLIDKGSVLVGSLPFESVHGLYRKGLVYLEVPIEAASYITVLPLVGFVMNRVTGDYFEKLLYEIFVSIDEHTTIAELSTVLDIDVELIKMAVSMYCRLGFACPKAPEYPAVHQSWNIMQDKKTEAANEAKKNSGRGELLLDWEEVDFADGESESDTMEVVSNVDCSEMASSTSAEELGGSVHSAGDGDSGSLGGPSHTKRIGFLFDSTLTAFLMMGNLSHGLKDHAVTLFEVGKMGDEKLEGLVGELEKIDCDMAEGEAQRYADHALNLLHTINFLRHNPRLTPGEGGKGLGLDLLRCESLLSLEFSACQRLLTKNYEVLFCMAPLANESRALGSTDALYMGPLLPEMSSFWFKLFLYEVGQRGPPTLVLSKGSKLRRLPAAFQKYEKMLVTTWGHDPAVLSTSNILFMVNDALSHSAIMLQGYPTSSSCTKHVSFPLIEDEAETTLPGVKRLIDSIGLRQRCGYVTLIKNERKTVTAKNNPDQWIVLDCHFGIPLFDLRLGQDVCVRLLNANPLTNESVDTFKESNRLLKIEVLSFISKWQDAQSYPKAMLEGAGSAKELASQSVPMPSRALYFDGEKLEDWNL